MDPGAITVPSAEAYIPTRDGTLKVPPNAEVTDLTPWAMASTLRSLTSYHTPVSAPLFLKFPKVGEVNQRSLGDCWFLASILAILHLPNGPKRVRQMMCERDGHVYVLLYDRSGRPHYLRLEKTVIHHDSGTQYHAKLDSALGAWPVFLEKALTAFDSDGDFDPALARYGRTEGGFGDRGLAVLLGVQTARIPIAPPVVIRETEAGQKFDRDLGLLFAGDLDPSKGDARQTLAQIFGVSNEQDWVDWQKWLAAWRKLNPHRDLMAELWQAVRGKQDARTHTLWTRTFDYPQTSIFDTPTWTTVQGGVFRLEHLQVWFGRLTPAPPLTLSTKVVAWVRRSQHLPGKRGTGHYTDSQLQTFRLMATQHDAGVPMTAGTRTYLGKSTQEYHYTDEEIKGLVSDHEYAVSDAFPMDDRCYVRLVNPWGNTGRKLKSGAYEAGKSQPVEKSDKAWFDLDLDDFTKRFEWLSYTTTPLPPVEDAS